MNELHVGQTVRRKRTGTLGTVVCFKHGGCHTLARMLWDGEKSVDRSWYQDNDLELEPTPVAAE